MTPTSSHSCPDCGAFTGPAARFCPGCGRACGTLGFFRPSDRLPWLIAGGALAATLVLLLAMMVGGSSPAPSAPAADPAAGAPPDLTRMTPRERFDRLYNRVMQAAQSGDEATAGRFMPMALAAYEMLDTLDADARFHAALLRVHGGDPDRASALGDTILARDPGHLLGYVVLGASARWRQDQGALRRIHADFLAHYDAEMKSDRPEYREHRFSIEEFHRAARQGGGGGTSGR